MVYEIFCYSSKIRERERELEARVYLKIMPIMARHFAKTAILPFSNNSIIFPLIYILGKLDLAPSKLCIITARQLLILDLRFVLEPHFVLQNFNFTLDKKLSKYNFLPEDLYLIIY